MFQEVSRLGYLDSYPSSGYVGPFIWGDILTDLYYLIWPFTSIVEVGGQ